MSEEPAEKPKLIIDDDWKERVQSEKEAAAAAVAAQNEAPDADAQASDGQESTSQDGAGQAETVQSDVAQEEAAQGTSQAEHELPPASFATLVHSLTAQALSSLGQIPGADGKAQVEIGLGKHFIDTLAVLEDKTKGNLDEEESAALAKMLYELRMLFVHIKKTQSGGPPAGEPAAPSL